MASMREQLGRRPAKYGFGQALGAAISGGGAYFGVLAVEKAKAEALEAARVGKLLDREYAQAEKADALDEDRAYKAGLLEDANSREDSLLTDKNNREDGKLASEANNVADTIEVKGSDLDTQYGMSFDKDNIDPNMIYKVEVDKQGNPLGVRESADVVVGVDGTIQKLSSGGSGVTAKSQTEARMKLRNSSRMLAATTKEMDRILGDGYNLKSGEAFLNRVASNVPFGNYLQSEEGQQFERAATRMAEIMFKAESGAAGSDAEAARYRSFIPEAGDTPAQVAMKMRILSAAQAAFADAGEDATYDEAVESARITAYETAVEAGFTSGKDSFRAPGYKSNTTSSPGYVEATPEDEAGYNSYIKKKKEDELNGY